MPELNPWQAGQKVGASRFTLVKPLGRGGMGEVWLAQDERLSEPVALKFLPSEVRADPVALDDLRRETARSHKLSHPNIVRIHDLQEDRDETAFIVMEYIDGATLAALRLQQSGGVLSWEYLRPLIQQLCAALDYAHREKVIHRDLKPANIMVDSRGRLKLADFGIAAVVSDSMSRISMRHSTSGTLPYMSPQQVTGKRPQATDDIYALGATLYELLTSKLPFHSGDITHQILHEPPEPMEERLGVLGIANEIPANVAALIMACLAKEPGQRPQSARAVAEWVGLELEVKPSTESLAAALFPQPPSSPEPVASEPTGMRESTPAVWEGNWAAVGIAALVIAASAIWLWKGSHRGDNSNAPVTAKVPAQTTEMEAKQKPSAATPTTTAAPARATSTAAQPSLQDTVTYSDDSNGTDLISSQVPKTGAESWMVLFNGISPQVPKPGADGWIVLFDGKRLSGCSPLIADVESGKLSVENGCLRLDSIAVRFNLIGRDMVIRARLKSVSCPNCQLSVRNCLAFYDGRDFFGIGKVVNRQYHDLATVHARGNYKGFFQLELRAEGENRFIREVRVWNDEGRRV